MKVSLEVNAEMVDTLDYDSGYVWTLWAGRAKLAQVWAESFEKPEVIIPRLLFEAVQLGSEK